MTKNVNIFAYDAFEILLFCTTHLKIYCLVTRDVGSFEQMGLKY